MEHDLFETLAVGAELLVDADHIPRRADPQEQVADLAPATDDLDVAGRDSRPEDKPVDVRGVAVVEDPVVAVTQVEGVAVRSGAAVQPVVADATGEGIVSAVGHDHVAARATVEDVGLGEAVDAVVRRRLRLRDVERLQVARAPNRAVLEDDLLDALVRLIELVGELDAIAAADDLEDQVVQVLAVAQQAYLARGDPGAEDKPVDVGGAAAVVDPVLAVARVEGIGVGPAAAPQDVVAEPAGHRVVPAEAAEAVVARAGRLLEVELHQIGVGPDGAVGEDDLLDATPGGAELIVQIDPVVGAGNAQDGVAAVPEVPGDLDVGGGDAVTEDQTVDVGGMVAFVDPVSAVAEIEVVVVGARAAVQHVVAPPAGDDVVAAAAVDGLVGPEADDRVAAARRGLRQVEAREVAGAPHRAVLEADLVDAMGVAPVLVDQGDDVAGAADGQDDVVAVGQAARDRDVGGRDARAERKAIEIALAADVGHAVVAVTGIEAIAVGAVAARERVVAGAAREIVVLEGSGEVVGRGGPDEGAAELPAFHERDEVRAVPQRAVRQDDLFDPGLAGQGLTDQADHVVRRREMDQHVLAVGRHEDRRVRRGERAVEQQPVEVPRTAVGDDRLALARAEDVGVAPRAAVQPVAAGAAFQDVRARAAEQAVVAGAALEPVRGPRPAQEVIAGLAEERVALAAGVEQVVVARAAEQPVVQGSAQKMVVARAAEEVVAEVAADDDVVAGTALQDGRRVDLRLAALQGLAAEVEVLADGRGRDAPVHGVAIDDDPVAALAAGQGRLAVRRDVVLDHLLLGRPLEEEELPPVGLVGQGELEGRGLVVVQEEAPAFVPVHVVAALEPQLLGAQQGDDPAGREGAVGVGSDQAVDDGRVLSVGGVARRGREVAEQGLQGPVDRLAVRADERVQRGVEGPLAQDIPARDLHVAEHRKRGMVEDLLGRRDGLVLVVPPHLEPLGAARPLDEELVFLVAHLDGGQRGVLHLAAQGPEDEVDGVDRSLAELLGQLLGAAVVGVDVLQIVHARGRIEDERRARLRRIGERVADQPAQHVAEERPDEGADEGPEEGYGNQDLSDEGAGESAQRAADLAADLTEDGVELDDLAGEEVAEHATDGAAEGGQVDALQKLGDLGGAGQHRGADLDDVGDHRRERRVQHVGAETGEAVEVVEPDEADELRGQQGRKLPGADLGPGAQVPGRLVEDDVDARVAALEEVQQVLDGVGIDQAGEVAGDRVDEELGAELDELVVAPEELLRDQRAEHTAGAGRDQGSEEVRQGDDGPFGGDPEELVLGREGREAGVGDAGTDLFQDRAGHDAHALADLLGIDVQQVDDGGLAQAGGELERRCDLVLEVVQDGVHHRAHVEVEEAGEIGQALALGQVDEDVREGAADQVAELVDDLLDRGLQRSADRELLPEDRLDHLAQDRPERSDPRADQGLADAGDHRGPGGAGALGDAEAAVGDGVLGIELRRDAGADLLAHGLGDDRDRVRAELAGERLGATRLGVRIVGEAQALGQVQRQRLPGDGEGRVGGERQDLLRGEGQEVAALRQGLQARAQLRAELLAEGRDAEGQLRIVVAEELQELGRRHLAEGDAELAEAAADQGGTQVRRQRSLARGVRGVGDDPEAAVGDRVAGIERGRDPGADLLGQRRRHGGDGFGPEAAGQIPGAVVRGEAEPVDQLHRQALAGDGDRVVGGQRQQPIRGHRQEALPLRQGGDAGRQLDAQLVAEGLDRLDQARVVAAEEVEKLRARHAAEDRPQRADAGTDQGVAEVGPDHRGRAAARRRLAVAQPEVLPVDRVVGLQDVDRNLAAQLLQQGASRGLDGLLGRLRAVALEADRLDGTLGSLARQVFLRQGQAVQDRPVDGLQAVGEGDFDVGEDRGQQALEVDLEVGQGEVRDIGQETL